MEKIDRLPERLHFKTIENKTQLIDILDEWGKRMRTLGIRITITESVEDGDFGCDWVLDIHLDRCPDLDTTWRLQITALGVPITTLRFNCNKKMRQIIEKIHEDLFI